MDESTLRIILSILKVWDQRALEKRIKASGLPDEQALNQLIAAAIFDGCVSDIVEKFPEIEQAIKQEVYRETGGSPPNPPESDKEP